MTYTRFMELFPNHDACLDYLKERFHPDGSECPKCGKATKFHRIKSRAAYCCQWCGHQVYPTAGTIFHKSTMNLQMWFWAIFLMSSTRCGISAKQLEREIGVSYPTAHRMFKLIRTLLSQDGDASSGQGRSGRDGWRRQAVRAGDSHAASRMLKRANKPTIWGAVERGGRVRAKVVKSRGTLDVEAADLHPRPTLLDDLHGRVEGLHRRLGEHTRPTSASATRTRSTSMATFTPRPSRDSSAS